MNADIPQDQFTPDTLDFLTERGTILLTTYKRDGTPVGTPVHLAIDDGRAYFRTWNTAWKTRRLLRNPEVEVAPSTVRGEPTGPTLHAMAHQITDDEAGRAARALAHRYPILHRWLIPWFHRLRGWRTVYFRLEPA
ncbi:MAG TPA: PPOX class F420-dependent oxidoreductase [Thermomicrobiales bacterium]|nr:PPOX class F420-dependent oxidoreductase [Thermomicrobiales bacterium]